MNIEPASTQTPSRAEQAVYWLTSIVIVGAGVFRLWNIHEAVNVDEVNVVARALEVAQGHLHIPWYNWPAQSLIRINGVIFAAVHAVSNMLHGTWTALEIPSVIPRAWFTIAHYTTVACALFGLLALWNVTYLLTRSRWASLTAVFLLSISSLHVIHSRFATPDMLLTTLSICSLWLGLLIMRSTNALHGGVLAGASAKKLKKYALVGGVIIGTAVATKYTGVITLVPILLSFIAIWVRQTRAVRGGGGLIIHVVSCLCILLITAGIAHTVWNPFFWSDLHLVRAALEQESNPIRIGADWGGSTENQEDGGNIVASLTHALSPHIQNAMYYIRGLQVWSGTLITWVAGITLLAFCIPKVRTMTPHMWLIIIYALAYLLGISSLGLHWSRWALPLTPIVALLCSSGLWIAWKIISPYYRAPWLRRTAVAKFVLVIITLSIPQAIVASITILRGTSGDTFHIAATCIQEHFEPGSHIIADAYFFNTLPQYTIDEIGIAAYTKNLADLRNEGVVALVIAPKRQGDAKQQPERYQYILDRFTELQRDATRVCTARATQDDILDHKKDFGLLQFLWKHRDDKKRFDIIDGDNYAVYDIR